MRHPVSTRIRIGENPTSRGRIGLRSRQSVTRPPVGEIMVR